MFACRDATQLLTEEREGALRGWLRAKLRVHLTICSHCRAYRRQMEETIALAKETRATDVPPAIEEGAVAAFRKRGDGVPRS
jgi:predicted anti-sigma-YlaC factor YlaD